MEEEISLRELIEVVIAGWKLIIFLTIGAMLTAGMFSYFIIKPTYQSTATVLVNSSHQDETGVFNLYLTKMVNPRVYSEQIQSQKFLQQIIDNHKLDEWSLSGLENNFSVEIDEDSTILTLTLKGGNPQELEKILNIIILEANKKISETIFVGLSQIADELQEQLEEEKKNLDTALKEYNQARASEGLPTIVLLDSLTSGANQYILNIDDKYLQEIQHIDKTKQVEFKKLNNKVNTITNLYNKYYSQYEHARSKAMLYNVNHDITVVSEPERPTNPIAPRKILNIAIAAVIGLMAGVGIVFFMHYWRETGNKA